MGMRLAARRNRAIKGFAVAGVVGAGLLSAGCAHEPTSPQQASVESCIQFSISALKHQVTVTSLPAVCRGLTSAQLNFAADAATDAMAGTMHGKLLARARRRELRPLLPRLASIVPAQRRQPVSTVATSQASGPPDGLAALVAWLITVGLGFLMMARWIARGELRRASAGKAWLRPTMNLAHLGLAVAGLVTWIIHLVTGLAGLAWIACVLLLPVAGLGISLVVLRLPERSLAGAAVSAAQIVPSGAGAVPAPVSLDPPSARHPPALVVAAHVIFAMATILYTLLAAIGSG
jgi:hypothetical protein